MRLNRKKLCGVGLLSAVGVLYLLELKTVGWGIPCIFHSLTGLRCPACGITSAVLALMTGDWRRAAACNYGLSLILPVLAAFLLYYLCIYLTDSPIHHRVLNRWAAGLTVYLLLWGVVRNLVNL